MVEVGEDTGKLQRALFMLYSIEMMPRGIGEREFAFVSYTSLSVCIAGDVFL